MLNTQQLKTAWRAMDWAATGTVVYVALLFPRAVFYGLIIANAVSLAHDDQQAITARRYNAEL